MPNKGEFDYSPINIEGGVNFIKDEVSKYMEDAEQLTNTNTKGIEYRVEITNCESTDQEFAEVYNHFDRYN